jgi:hypothetical protein
MSKSLEETFVSTLNEKQKRLYAGLRASELGRSGVTGVSQQLKLHPHTVRSGKKQLALARQSTEPMDSRVRRVGGGPKKSGTTPGDSDSL